MDRKYIRKKVQQLLKDANIQGIGQDVFSQRSIPDSIETLPVANVYVLDIDSTLENHSVPKSYRRNLPLIIEIKTTHDNDDLLADEMDDLSLWVENAIENALNTKLEGEDHLFKQCFEAFNLTGVRYKTEGEAQSPIGSATLVYNVEYLKDVEIDYPCHDLITIDNTYQMNGNEDKESKDQINFEE